jgi:hypothetical protein
VPGWERDDIVVEIWGQFLGVALLLNDGELNSVVLDGKDTGHRVPE